MTACIKQTVFDLMDHLSRWITQARKCRADIVGQKKIGRAHV